MFRFSFNIPYLKCIQRLMVCIFNFNSLLISSLLLFWLVCFSSPLRSQCPSTPKLFLEHGTTTETLQGLVFVAYGCCYCSAHLRLLLLFLPGNWTSPRAGAFFLLLSVSVFCLIFSSQETKPCHRRARLAWSCQEGAHLRRKVKNLRISKEKKHWLLMTLIVLF